MPPFNQYVVSTMMGDEPYSTVVETGTFKGTTTQKLASKFAKVYTIEIDEKLHKNAVNRFATKKLDNIVALLGDSREVLRELVPTLHTCRGDRAVFFLDAHWSGDVSVDWEKSEWKGYGRNTGYTGKQKGSSSGSHDSNPPTSRQQVPLEEEIMCIFNCYDGECLVYIDDFDAIDATTKRGFQNFKFAGQDWSHLDFNDILRQVQSRTVEIQNLGGKQLMLKFKAKEIAEEGKKSPEEAAAGTIFKKAAASSSADVLSSNNEQSM